MVTLLSAILFVASLGMYLWYLASVEQREQENEIRPVTEIQLSGQTTLSRLLLRAGVFDWQPRQRCLRSILYATLAGGASGLMCGSLLGSASAALVGGAIGLHLVASSTTFGLVEAAKRYREGLLIDLTFFAQQLMMVNAAGLTVERGLRAIAEVHRSRPCHTRFEVILNGAVEIAGESGRVGEQIAKFGMLSKTSELQRMVEIAIRAEEQGVPIDDRLRDMIEECRIHRIAIPGIRALFGGQNELDAGLSYDSGSEVQRIRNVGIVMIVVAFFLCAQLVLWGAVVVIGIQGMKVYQRCKTRLRSHFYLLPLGQDLLSCILSVSSFLKTGCDSMTALTLYSQQDRGESPMRNFISQTLSDVRSGVPESVAVANLGLNAQHRGVDLFVQAILLSNRAPRVLDAMLQTILSDLREQVVRET